MSYIVLLSFIIGGYVLGIPIQHESLQFRFVECISGDNETSKHVLEILDFNDTCIKVNQSSSEGNEVYFYVDPQTENGVQLRITTENCSTPLPDLHLSLCDDKSLDDNSTDIMVTYAYNNVSNIDPLYVDNNITTTTEETFLYTGPTVYETLHHLNLDSDEEENSVTNKPSIVKEKSDSSSEEKSAPNFFD